MVRPAAVRTSLCVVIGRAASGQQLGLQAFDLSVFGGQELLQLRDLCLWRKAEYKSVSCVGLPGQRISRVVRGSSLKATGLAASSRKLLNSVCHLTCLVALM